MSVGPASAGTTEGSTRVKVLLGAVLFFFLLTIIGVLFSLHMVLLGAVVVVLVVMCMQSPGFGTALLVVSMLFSPEFVVAGGVHLRAEEAIIPLIAVSLALRACLPRFGFRFRFSSLDAPIAMVVVVGLVSSVRGYFMGTVDATTSLLWNIKQVELFSVYWVTFNFVRDPRQARRLLFIAFLVLLAIVLYASFQIPGTEVHTVNRLSAPFEGNPEPTTLGGYLTLLLCMVLSMAIYAEDRRKGYLLWGLGAVVLVPIVFTLSRTTYVSCGVAILALAILTRHKGLLLATIVGGILSPLLMPGKVIGRILMTFDPSRPAGLDTSFMERIYVWRKAQYALQKIEKAIVEAGGQMSDVVRTRIYVTDFALFDDLARAHSEVFGDIRPASSAIEAKLVEPGLLVEIEATAMLQE